MPRAGSCPRRTPREPSDISPRCRSLVPPCATQKREKVDDFYAARSRTIPPLPWSSFPPPFSHPAHVGLQQAEHRALRIGDHGVAAGAGNILRLLVDLAALRRDL